MYFFFALVYSSVALEGTSNLIIKIATMHFFLYLTSQVYQLHQIFVQNKNWTHILSWSLLQIIVLAFRSVCGIGHYRIHDCCKNNLPLLSCNVVVCISYHMLFDHAQTFSNFWQRLHVNQIYPQTISQSKFIVIIIIF